MSLIEIESRWDYPAYQAMIDTLLSNGFATVDISKFALGHPGVWLRHDVEIQLGPCLEVARIEASMGVSATYFLCPESPLLVTAQGGDPAFQEAIDELLGLGHAVGCHILLRPAIPSLDERLAGIRRRFPRIDTALRTFHAPGLSSLELAEVAGGAPVYRPMAEQTCRYLSDSTGRWRWGDPSTLTLDDRAHSIQILTHPFWWSGGVVRHSLRAAYEEVSTFLPQHVLARQSEVDSIAGPGAGEGTPAR